MKNSLFKDDYAINSLFAGVGEALLLAVEYIAATVGAVCLGMVAGQVELGFLSVVGVIIGGVLLSYSGFIISIFALIGLIVSWKSYLFRLDGLFLMFICNVLIGFKSFNGSLNAQKGMGLAAVLLLPSALYLLIRIPLWRFLLQQKKEQRESKEIEAESSPDFVFCPACNARLWLDENGDLPASCALCGQELKREDEAP